ncbi:MAG: methylmalonyl-CoA mutase family protein [Acidimicrobiales bacterium]
MPEPPADWLLLAEWRERYASRLDPGETGAVTNSGLDVDALYAPDAEDLTEAGRSAYVDRIGMPGEAPFTRGIWPGMYRERLWVMGQYSGAASPKATNERIRSLLAAGQRGFSVALDLPTQNGLDSDHELARGEVGKVGVPIDSRVDMEELLAGIDLSNVAQIRTTANAIGPLAVALFVVGAEAHGYSPTDFKVMLQNDVLKEYIARGTYVFPPEAGLRFSVDVVEYCSKELPHWEPIEFCGYHIRDSGSTAVQELAIAFAHGRAYIDEALRRGLSIDDFAHSAYLFLSADLDLFEEVAKFRAARRIWHDLIRKQYGATNPDSWAAKIFCYTLGGSQVAKEPANNIARIAYQALAAVLGGVQTLATSSYDEAIQLPSDEAVRISLRTQQILAYETGVTRTADPLGGSYFVEALTDEIEKAVLEYMAVIEEHGGPLAAIESGWIRGELDDAAYKLAWSFETGARTQVGVNRFSTTDEDVTFREHRSTVETERLQIERVKSLRRSRDNTAVDRCLDQLRDDARSGTNTLPSVIDAIRNYATVGEVCGALADVWGRHRASNRL